MKLEYLFPDKKDQEKAVADEHLKGKAIRTVTDIENAACWLLAFQTEGDTPDDAELLSGLHDHIMEAYAPVVLTDESSACFNQILYPLFNSFERKLRKLFDLKSALNPAQSDTKNIQHLEEQDLGSIFDMLFTDTDFITAVKQTINERTWKYTKEEILQALNTLPEDVLWDHLIGADAVPTLRKSFSDVRRYRNDTMHAHHMNADSFQKAKRLIERINGELDSEIQNVIGRAEKQVQTEGDRQFNTKLTAALEQLWKHCQSEENEGLLQHWSERREAVSSFLHAKREKAVGDAEA